MEWTVSKQVIELRTHPNADALDLLKVGQHQLVARKGVYRPGDTVLFIAEKSVLPAGPLCDEFGAYLVGPQKDRVTHLRLRGEYSCGVTWPLSELERFGPEVAGKIEAAAIGENVAELLGIVKYEPPVPQHLAGQVEALGDTPYFGGHDALHLAAYLAELGSDEQVSVTSKGVGSRGMRLREDAGNTYWTAVMADRLPELTREAFAGRHVQLFGEVIPAQKGFGYGFTKPHVRLFEVRVDGQSVAYDALPDALRELWVPLLYRGPLDLEKIQALAKGPETVSGKALHIREGVVVRPVDVNRLAADGSRLHLKVINPKYKETGEELS